ncbi:MAG: M48 family metalloprotease [Phycisphaerales bacterium]
MNPETLCIRRLRGRNKARALVLAVVLIALGAPAGALLGEVIELVVTHQPRVWPAVVGAVAGVVFTSALGLWAYLEGARTIIAAGACCRVRWTDDPELLSIVDDLRLKAGIYMPRVYVQDDTALNAFSVGRSERTARLVVTAGLRRALPPDEIRAVIAHEIGHIRAGDSCFMLLMATMLGLLVFLCDWAWRVAWGAGRGAKHSTDAAKFSGLAAVVWGGCFVVSGILFVVAPALSWLMQAIIRREREYIADALAVDLTGDTGALARALSRIAADPAPFVDVANRATAHLYIANPLERMRRTGQSWDSFLCSHPPIEKRIARLTPQTQTSAAPAGVDGATRC